MNTDCIIHFSETGEQYQFSRDTLPQFKDLRHIVESFEDMDEITLFYVNLSEFKIIMEILPIVEQHAYYPNIGKYKLKGPYYITVKKLLSKVDLNRMYHFAEYINSELFFDTILYHIAKEYLRTGIPHPLITLNINELDDLDPEVIRIQKIINFYDIKYHRIHKDLSPLNRMLFYVCVNKKLDVIFLNKELWKYLINNYIIDYSDGYFSPNEQIKLYSFYLSNNMVNFHEAAFNMVQILPKIVELDKLDIFRKIPLRYSLYSIESYFEKHEYLELHSVITDTPLDICNYVVKLFGEIYNPEIFEYTRDNTFANPTIYNLVMLSILKYGLPKYKNLLCDMINKTLYIDITVLRKIIKKDIIPFHIDTGYDKHYAIEKILEYDSIKIFKFNKSVKYHMEKKINKYYELLDDTVKIKFFYEDSEYTNLIIKGIILTKIKISARWVNFIRQNIHLIKPEYFAYSSPLIRNFEVLKIFSEYIKRLFSDKDYIRLTEILKYTYNYAFTFLDYTGDNMLDYLKFCVSKKNEYFLDIIKEILVGIPGNQNPEDYINLFRDSDYEYRIFGYLHPKWKKKINDDINYIRRYLKHKYLSETDFYIIKNHMTDKYLYTLIEPYISRLWLNYPGEKNISAIKTLCQNSIMNGRYNILVSFDTTKIKIRKDEDKDLLVENIKKILLE